MPHSNSCQICTATFIDYDLASVNQGSAYVIPNHLHTDAPGIICPGSYRAPLEESRTFLQKYVRNLMKILEHVPAELLEITLEKFTVLQDRLRN